MRGISPKVCVLVIVAILIAAFWLDFEMFKALLTWTLGGLIVLLLNVAFFGDLLRRNKEVQDFFKLLREGVAYLKGILENKKKAV